MRQGFFGFRAVDGAVAVGIRLLEALFETRFSLCLVLRHSGLAFGAALLGIGRTGLHAFDARFARFGAWAFTLGTICSHGSDW